MICNMNEQHAVVYEQAYLCLVGLSSSIYFNDLCANMMSVIECAASAVAISWYTAAKVFFWYMYY